MLQPIIGMDLDEITHLCLTLGGTQQHALKLARAIYRKRVSDLTLIDDLPKWLLDRIAQQYNVGLYSHVQNVTDTDLVSKQLYENAEHQRFESVFMPSEKRKTLCISSQAGCRMGCKFCLTGKIGFHGNLLSTDIINQVMSLQNSMQINRIVVMGMGEPFDNYAQIQKSLQILNSDWGLAFGRSNITISTVGLIEQLKQFVTNPLCNLAISLHSPFPDQRAELMPSERTNPIAQVVDIIKNNPFKKPLRVSFEYVALAGVNMSQQHAVAIGRLLHGIRYHLNIIPWNEHQNSQFATPSTAELNSFIQNLNREGVLTAVRKSRANRINAACGQMVARNYDK